MMTHTLQADSGSHVSTQRTNTRVTYFRGRYYRTHVDVCTVHLAPESDGKCYRVVTHDRFISSGPRRYGADVSSLVSRRIPGVMVPASERPIPDTITYGNYIYERAPF